MIKRKTSGPSQAKFTLPQQRHAFVRHLDINALRSLKQQFDESQNAMILFEIRHICRRNNITIPDWAEAQIARVDAQIFRLLNPTHRRLPERNVTPLDLWEAFGLGKAGGGASIQRKAMLLQRDREIVQHLEFLKSHRNFQGRSLEELYAFIGEQPHYRLSAERVKRIVLAFRKRRPGVANSR
jgi:hypothetical protein